MSGIVSFCSIILLCMCTQLVPGRLGTPWSEFAHTAIDRSVRSFDLLNLDPLTPGQTPIDPLTLQHWHEETPWTPLQNQGHWQGEADPWHSGHK